MKTPKRKRKVKVARRMGREVTAVTLRVVTLEVEMGVVEMGVSQVFYNL
jgi:hypothetical protein